MIEDNEGEQIEQTETEPGENGTEEEVLELTEEAEGEPEAEPEKPKGKSVQERIDEITAARREAERDAEYWRNKALEKQPEKQTEAEPEESPRPKPEDFEFGDADPNYWDALTEWKAEQKVNARFSELEQRQTVAQTLHELEAGYTQRVAAVKEEIPDYDEVVTKTAARGEWPCPPVVALAAKDSEVGPKVLHHLATNKAEAIALSNLSPIEQAMAFGRLEARFLNSTAPQPKIATNAPEPAPNRTKGGQFAPSSLDDRVSISAWMEQRNKQARG